MHTLYDLHTHSDCSDGQLSPTALVNLAKEKGVTTLALTDHDTLAGIDEATLAAGTTMTLIPGIELSTLWRGYTIHIVGLQIEVTCKRLQQAVSRQCATREKRAQLIGERLAKAGVKGAYEGACYYANGDSIGRPHFAQYMIDAGYVDTFAQAFKRYLGAGKAGDVKHQWPGVGEAVEWITGAKGIAVLAHPDKYGLTRTKLYELLKEFVSAGGQGIEVVNGDQDPSVTAKLARAAQDFSLLASCGSDFHSTENLWQSPGKMSPLPSDVQTVWDYW